MTTLSKVMERTWRKLGMGVDIVATGGSTTTVIDTNGQYTSDDTFNRGTVVVVRDAGGASAAPEGEFATISDYVALTHTWTVGTLSAAVAAGDVVMIANAKIPLQQMIQAVNDALKKLGTITLIDTSLTTAANQTEYALPVALKQMVLKDVLIPTVDDSNDHQYMSIFSQCRTDFAGPGSTGILYTPQLAADDTLRLVYEGTHPTVYSYSASISETIPDELVTAAVVDEALTWLVSKRGESVLGTFLLQRWNDAKQTLANVKIEMPIYRAKRKARFFVSPQREW